jgi:hypothetical protein
MCPTKVDEDVIERLAAVDRVGHGLDKSVKQYGNSCSVALVDKRF